MRVLLANPTALPGQTQGLFQSSGSAMGRIMSGGIAGVASRAEGHSIKTVNDQSDYSLWEFYYDPTKDLTRLPGAATPGANRGTTPGTGTTNANPNPGGFGQSPFNATSPLQPGATPPPTATPPPPNPPPA
jgi:hypothetical protein